MSAYRALSCESTIAWQFDYIKSDTEYPKFQFYVNTVEFENDKWADRAWFHMDSICGTVRQILIKLLI